MAPGGWPKVTVKFDREGRIEQLRTESDQEIQPVAKPTTPLMIKSAPKMIGLYITDHVLWLNSDGNWYPLQWM